MAITKVNAVSGSTSTTLVSSVATSSFSATTGNLIVIGINWYNPGTPPTSATITDTAGNTYTLVASTSFDANNKSAIYYAKNISGNASNVVTASFSPQVSYTSIIALEYSGADTASPLDTSVGTNVTSTTSATTGAFTTTSANEVICVLGHDSGATGMTFTAGSGYTLQQTSPLGSAAMEDKIVSSIQTGVTASMSASAAGIWAMVAATFKAPPPATLSASPSTSLVGLTGVSITLTGISTSWSAGTPGTPTFTLSGGTGASITAQTVASGTSATITLTTGSSAGTLTVTDPSTGATASIVIGLSHVYPDDANILYTGRWARSGSGSSARAKTINCGSYFDVVVTGTTAITLDFDETGLDASGYPDILYQVDGGAPTRATLSTGAGMSVALTLPVSSMSIHRVRVFAEGITEGSSPSFNQWTSQAGAVNFKSLTIDYGSTTLAIPASKNRMVVLGDSIVASIHMLATSGSSVATQMAGHNSWAMQAGQILGLATEIVGFGGQGLTSTGSGSVPIANTAFPLVYSGVSYTPPSNPTIVVVAQGTNDSGASGATFRAAYTTYLATIRAAYPNALIFCLGQPSNSHAADVSTVVTAVADSKIFYLDYTALSLATTDGTHLDTAGATKLAAQLASDVQSQLNSLSIIMTTPAGKNGSRIFLGF